MGRVLLQHSSAGILFLFVSLFSPVSFIPANEVKLAQLYVWRSERFVLSEFVCFCNVPALEYTKAATKAAEAAVRAVLPVVLFSAWKVCICENARRSANKEEKRWNVWMLKSGRRKRNMKMQKREPLMFLEPFIFPPLLFFSLSFSADILGYLNLHQYLFLWFLTHIMKSGKK